MRLANNTIFGFGLDYCRSILHDGKGAAFVPSPASGELLPFGDQVIELTGYSDMWGEYRDSLHCKVIQFFNPKFSIRNGISSRCYLFFERPLLVLNENNGNPTCSSIGSEPTRSVVVGHQAQSDLSLFGGTLIQNLSTCVNFVSD